MNKKDKLISGRILESENIEFAEERIKKDSMAVFIRQAVTIYRKYLSGELFKEELQGEFRSFMRNEMKKEIIPTMKELKLILEDQDLSANEKNEALQNRLETITDKTKSKVKNNDWGL